MPSEQPKQIGWHWFLPDISCPTPTGLLRIDKPVIVLVGQVLHDRAGDPKQLCVRFPSGTMLCNTMTGMWERIEEPKEMADEARKRWCRR